MVLKSLKGRLLSPKTLIWRFTGEIDKRGVSEPLNSYRMKLIKGESQDPKTLK